METAERTYLTSAEVAQICRVAPETIRYWRHVGRGPRHFRLGKRVLYSAADVHDWIDTQRSCEQAS